MSEETTHHPVCPGCGSRGRSLQRETLEAQLRPEVAAGAEALDGYHFCAISKCDVVYFSGGDIPTINTADLTLDVFQKSSKPSRLVCYCFEHSVGTLQVEVAATGSSGVPGDIKAKCKAGLDACHLKNPQGVCCLGNVLGVVKQAQAERSSHQQERSDPEETSCCGHSKEPTP